jgi:deoxyadenosine/deoxycytidine kinase
LPVAKVFAAAMGDIPGTTAQNPVDLTMDDTDSEPTSSTQSLPYPGNTGMDGGLQIDIPEEIQTYRPTIISIEGIMGVGKSEVLEILTQKYHDNPEVLILKEPSFAWENIRVDGMNLLELSYHNPRRYGFLFQLIYFTAVERQLQEALNTHKSKRVIICERSLLSARVVYTEMIPELDRIKYGVYQTLFSKEGVGDVYPNHIILLDTEPRDCVGRVSRKDWRGDEIITLEYLQRCRRCHLEMKRRHSGNWTTINSQEGQMESIVERVMKAVEETEPIENTPQLEPQSTEVKLVSIEGNIGAGKSTFLNDIEKVCKNRRIDEIRILREPVDEWERITDGTKTILELFYENPAEYGFPLQVLVGITTLRRINRELSDYPDTKLILSERSVLSSKMVFAKMLHHDGCMDDVEEEVYQTLFNDTTSTWVTPAMILYLKTEASTCLERVGNRNRRGESKITVSQLERCELYHEIMFRQIGIHVRTINIDLEVDGVIKDWCNIVITWCQQLMRGLRADQLESPIRMEVPGRDNQDANIYLEFQFKVSNETGREKPLPIVDELKKGTDKDREEIYLIKLTYGNTYCRMVLPDSKLTGERFTWEILQLWPTLLEQEVILKWSVLMRNSTGSCEDKDLNESLEHIEGIEGRKIDFILLIEMQTSSGEEGEGTTNKTTIKDDGGKL